MITYRIIGHYWENYSNQTLPYENEQGNNVLYNRWTESVDYDKSMYCTKTRTGKFAIRSDNKNGKIPDDIRTQMAVVGVQRGFNRESSSYTVTPDGLGLQYKIVDKEVYLNPPPGAYECDGDYKESTTGGGVMTWGEVRVWLRTCKPVGSLGIFGSPTRLVDTAVRVAASKLAIRGGELTGTSKPLAFLESITLVRKLYDNTIECIMRGMYKTKRRTFHGVPFLDYGAFVRTPLSQDDRPPTYFDRGTSNILLHAAAYYDPSIEGTQLDRETGQLTTGLEPGKAGVQVES